MSDVERLARLFEKNLPLFTALGDPTRQQLVMLMVDGHPKSVKELTAGTSLSRPTISHHLKVLKDAHILIEHKKGRQIYYRPHIGEYFHSLKELIDTVDQIIKQEGME